MEIYSSQRRSINDRALQDVDMVLDDAIDNVASRLRCKALVDTYLPKVHPSKMRNICNIFN